jgi:cobalt-zinc-cadmium efflux system outer membrane protein
LLTGLPEDKDIVPVINEQKIIYSLSDLSNLRELLSLAQSRPDVVAQGLGIQASEHEVKLQKANALPQVSLQGGYDENGFAIGVGVSIPIFNHNQGNIRAAEIQTQQAMLQQEMNKQQMEADIRQDYNQLFLDKKIVDEADQNFSNSIDGMINQAEIQYMKRNISLLEFLDMYTSYKDSYIAIIEAKNQLLQSAIQLNVHVGRDVIKLNY